MIGKKWFNVFFYLLLIVVLLSIIYLFVFGVYQNMMIDKGTQDGVGTSKRKIHEGFTSGTVTDHKNILTNSTFEGGADVSGYTDQSGFNEITTLTNPSTSKYVLHQKDTQSTTYYQISQPIQPNSKYVFTTWVCALSLRQGDMEQFPFHRLVRFRIPMKDGTNDLPSPSAKVLQKTTLKSGGNNYDWYLVKYTIHTKADVKRDMNIYLNYGSELSALDIYFAGLGLYKVLDDIESFVYTNGLLAFLSGFFCDSGAISWRDLSANSMNFLLDTRASPDQQNGSVDLSKNMLSLAKGKEIYGSHGDQSMTHLLIEIDTGALATASAKNPLFQITQKDSTLPILAITLEDNKCLTLSCRDQTATTPQPPILLNKTLLTLAFDQKTHTSQLYQDGALILTLTTCPTLFFEDSTISMNPNKNIPLKLYDLLIYNYLMNATEIKDLRTYLMDTTNRRSTTPDTQNYIFTSMNSNQPTTVEGFSNEEGVGTQSDQVYQDEFLYVFGNTENAFSNLKKELCSAKPEVTINDCPSVYLREGKYYVYIPQYSYYHKQFNYYGERCYGEDRDRAKYLFTMNFPECDVPKALRPGEGKVNNTCPFIVSKNNPCAMDSCAGVDWSKGFIEDLSLSEECKKGVSFYCRTNYDLDEQCKAWKPDNKFDEESVNVRKYFEDPNEYCDVNQFDIEDHPDFANYIRKDMIPCWGCDLSDEMPVKKEYTRSLPSIPPLTATPPSSLPVNVGVTGSSYSRLS